VRELQEHELKYKHKLIPLIKEMFSKFFSYREHWRNVVSCLSEIDALCSVASISCQPGMTKPYVQESSKPFLELKRLRHPCLEGLT